MQTTSSRMLRGAAVALCLAGVLAGCRRQVVWSGIAMEPATGTIKLAAQEPNCGCTTIANTSGQVIRLRATFRDSTIGSTSLQPGQRLRFRFDWAGPANDDVYVLHGTTENGQPVDLTKAIRVEENPRWEDCSSASCTYGALMMNLGETGR